jgi:hypothetical protein
MGKAKTSSKKSAADGDVVGSQKAYEHYLPAAAAIDAAEVRPFRADASLAYHNIERALDSIAPFIDQIKEELPTIHVKELAELSELALAVMFAAAQVDRANDGSTPKLLVEARELRDLMLTGAEALAKAGLVPSREVARIREGNGLIDTAQDCVDLAALFLKHAKKVKGKTAVSKDDVKQAAKIGTELLRRLKPKGAKGKGPEGLAEAVANRDRLWTLLVKRHRELRRVGMWIWADEVDAHVPALQSRVAKKKSDKPAEPISPEPEPAAPPTA